MLFSICLFTFSIYVLLSAQKRPSHVFLVSLTMASLHDFNVPSLLAPTALMSDCDDCLRWN